VNIIDDKLTGEIEQTFYGFNTNMLKNYRNRFHGALNGRIREIFPGYIRIAETPLYSVEPAWIEYMSVTIICFGILLSGFLFASLSVSTDRGLKHFFHYSRISPIAIYSAKFTGAFIKTLLTAFIYIAVIQSFLIQLPVPHFTFIAGICIPAFFSINAGLLLGGLTDNPIVTFLISLISALVLWLSGGGFGTAMVVGPLLRKIAWLNPANGCIKLLINSWFGGSSSEILHIIYPVLLGLTCCVFGLSVFNKKYYLPGGLK
jgi:ABC-type polysaccharide/polyol phosphate export permease